MSDNPEATVVIVGEARLARTAELAHLLGDRFQVETYEGIDPAEVAELVGGRPRKLLEAVAEDVATLVLADERVRQVRVRVTKPQAPLPVDGCVAVEITRDREATGEERA